MDVGGPVLARCAPPAPSPVCRPRTGRPRGRTDPWRSRRDVAPPASETTPLDARLRRGGRSGTGRGRDGLDAGRRRWAARRAGCAGPSRRVRHARLDRRRRHRRARLSAGGPPPCRRGAELFRDWCATCHGADARGGGPMHPVLAVAAPDLTCLAAGRSGLPHADVVRRIGTAATCRSGARIPAGRAGTCGRIRVGPSRPPARSRRSSPGWRGCRSPSAARRAGSRPRACAARSRRSSPRPPPRRRRRRGRR